MVVYPFLGVIKLNMALGAANDYLSLTPYYEKNVRGYIWDAWASLLKIEKYNTLFTVENFTSNFPYLTIIEIRNDIMNLKIIDMPVSLIMCTIIGK